MTPHPSRSSCRPQRVPESRPTACQRQGLSQAAAAHLRSLQGFELGRAAALQFLDSFKQPVQAEDREQLLCVARTSLRTKLYSDLADQLTDIVVDAVLTIRRPDEPIDLFMVRARPSDHADRDSQTPQPLVQVWLHQGQSGPRRGHVVRVRLQWG